MIIALPYPAIGRERTPSPRCGWSWCDLCRKNKRPRTSCASVADGTRVSTCMLIGALLVRAWRAVIGALDARSPTGKNTRGNIYWRNTAGKPQGQQRRILHHPRQRLQDFVHIGAVFGVYFQSLRGREKGGRRRGEGEGGRP